MHISVNRLENHRPWNYFSEMPFFLDLSWLVAVLTLVVRPRRMRIWPLPVGNRPTADPVERRIAQSLKFHAGLCGSQSSALANFVRSERRDGETTLFCVFLRDELQSCWIEFVSGIFLADNLLCFYHHCKFCKFKKVETNYSPVVWSYWLEVSAHKKITPVEAFWGLSCNKEDLVVLQRRK